MMGLQSSARRIAVVTVVWALVIVGAGTLAPAMAQTNEASLSGIVFDSSGSVMPGVTVTLTSQSTNITRSTVSNETGAYQFPFVQPGTYNIEASLDGFKSLRREGLVLSAAQSARVNLTMEVGGLTETVSVDASAGPLNTASAQISEVINAEKAEALPLNGRNFWSLPQLAPGVTPPARGSGNSLRGGFNVSGSGDTQNYFTLNGLDNNDSVTATPLFRPSIDAIGEMTVLTGLYPAQYGFLSGGQIITSIKSGTNAFHGSAFDFIRDSAIGTSKNYFQTDLPDYNRNTFGATFGGPIARSKTFFFASYEGLRLNESVPINSTVPTMAMRAGDFSALPTAIRDPQTGQPFPGNIIPASRMSAVGSALLAIYPAPTKDTPAGSLPANNHFWNPTRPEETNTYSFKIDHTFSTKDTAYVSLNSYRQSSHEPIGRTGCNGGSQLPNLGCELVYKADVYGFSETHIFSSQLINQIYMGYSLGQQPYAADGTSIDFWGQFGYHPRTEMPVGLPTTGVPNLSMTGYTGYQAGSQYRKDPRYQVTDTISWVRGRHGITAGLNFTHLNANYVRNIPVSGSLTFTNTSAGPTTGYALADVLLGLPSSTAYTDKALEMNFNSNSSAVFVQDDYKVSGRLSLNLGVRWEVNSPLREGHNYVNSFDTETGKPIVAGQNGVGDHVYDYDWKAIAPRLGFAWQPTASGNTVIRGGFGTFYNRLQVGSQSFLIWGQYPFINPYTFTSSVAQPITLANPFPTSNAVTTITVTGVEENFKNPKTNQWNVGFQRQLVANMTADIAYVGSSSSNQMLTTNINQAPAGPGTPAQVNARRPYPQYGTINYYSWDGTGNYHSLQSKLSRRLSDGLSFTVAYTLSKSIDDGNARTNQFDPSTGRGPSSFDIGSRLVISGMYELPFGVGHRWLTSGVGSAIFGGWQVTPVFQTQTGQPLTATLNGNFSNSGGGSSDRPDVTGDPNENAPHTIQQWFDTSVFQVPVASGQPNAQYSFGNAGVGIIRGPGLTNFDLSLVKNVKLGGKGTLQFRAEMFNVFNTTNWGLPGLQANTSTFGIISTAADPRLTQFSLKLTF
jgi:Carboxypeptidase regulatory-like domain/TonB-dependent Receptor Plug Domain